MIREFVRSSVMIFRSVATATTWIPQSVFRLKLREESRVEEPANGAAVYAPSRMNGE